MFTETNRRLRGHRFYPTKTELKSYPKIYAQDSLHLNAIVHVHYFSGGNDWWITEFARDFATTGEAFGYVRLAGNPQGAEFGYIYLPELEELLIRRGFPVWIERDCYWTPKTVREAARICGDGKHYCTKRNRCADAPAEAPATV